MEERDFFYELCETTLAVDKNIRFAGVIDEAGKLLVGNYRKDIESPLINSSSLTEQKKNSFHTSYVSISMLKAFEPHLGGLRYQLTEYDNVKLVTIPLTSRNDRYLCVSMDPAISCQAAVSKIIKKIS